MRREPSRWTCSSVLGMLRRKASVIAVMAGILMDVSLCFVAVRISEDGDGSKRQGVGGGLFSSMVSAAHAPRPGRLR